MAKTTGKGDTAAYVSPWRGKMASISMLAGREIEGVAALVTKAASWRTKITRRQRAIVGKELTWSSLNSLHLPRLLLLYPARLMIFVMYFRYI
jgi:hypothetical protein